MKPLLTEIKPSPGRILWVDPQDTLPDEGYGPKFYTMSDAFRRVQRGDTIILIGKLKEPGIVAPANVADVTIIGATTRVRPGHSHIDYMMGGSADWSNGRDNETDPLITVVAQGWVFKNLHFGGVPRSASVRLARDVEFTKSANHTAFHNCAFSGGRYGIEDFGGNANVGVFGCQFYGDTPDGTAIASTDISVAYPLMWEIVGNRFINNTHHIHLPLSNSIIKDNILFRRGYTLDNAISIDLSGGGKNNVVTHNHFTHPSNENGYVNSAYAAGDGDSWGPNFCSDREVYGLPRE